LLILTKLVSSYRSSLLLKIQK